jgi:hypothetical protein
MTRCCSGICTKRRNLVTGCCFGFTASVHFRSCGTRRKSLLTKPSRRGCLIDVICKDFRKGIGRSSSLEQVSASATLRTTSDTQSPSHGRMDTPTSRLMCRTNSDHNSTEMLNTTRSRSLPIWLVASPHHSSSTEPAFSALLNSATRANTESSIMPIKRCFAWWDVSTPLVAGLMRRVVAGTAKHSTCLNFFPGHTRGP